MYKKLALSSLFATSLLALTACGGDTSTSSLNNENTTHPAFSWAKVAVSNNYSPSGDTTDLTPTFSWKAVPGATVYNFGHEDTDTALRWHEYTVTPKQANCTTTASCSYTPEDVTLAEGDQKAWWLRAKTTIWSDWSAPYVFRVIGNTPPTTPPTSSEPISPKGKIPASNPTFTWTPGNGATDYQFGFENQDGSDWRQYTLTASSLNCQATLCSYDGLFNFNHGDNKTWWVRSKINNTWSNWSNGADFNIDIDTTTPPDTEAPSTPTNLHVEEVPNFTPKSFFLKWNLSTDNDRVSHYEVYKDGIYYYKTNGVVQPTLPTGTHTYAVVAFDYAGNESDWSESLTVNIQPQPVNDTEAPITPANLKLGNYGCRISHQCRSLTTNLVYLKWDTSTDNVAVTAYALYRDGLKIQTQPTNTFTDNTVSPATTYSYTVTALDAANNESVMSNTFTVTTLEIDTEAPTIPQNLRIDGITPTSADLIWDASMDNDRVNHYIIYRNGDFLYKTNAYRNAGMQYTDRTVQSGETYSYTVEAEDRSGNISMKSSELIVTVP